MSTLSGVSLKGEKSKGKSSFQSLKINSIYKGESTEGNQHKSIVQRKNGLQPLGKVIRNVRNPVNLPSEKSESSHESTINLVPIGGAGWGNKQPTEKSLVGASKEVPPASTATTPSQLSQSGPVQGQQHVSSHSTSVQVTTTTTRAFHADGKTWAKKIVDVPVAPPYLAHRTMQFQQEFPSLTSSGEQKNVINTNAPIPANTEQRPSLRPQTETSWMQGGSRPQMPQGVGGVTGVPGQIHSQISIGTDNVNGVRNNSVQNGVAGAQVGLNPYQMQYNMTKNPVMRNMLPNFMVSNQSDNVPHHPKQHIYHSERMLHHISSSSMANDGALSKPSTDIKELIPPPIIREEDLKRMNELSKEAGWSIQGEIDYNKKLDFSDDEDQLNEKSNKQSLNGDIRIKSDNVKCYFGNKTVNCDPSSVHNLKEGMFTPMNVNGIPYTTDYMQYYRPQSHQEERQIDDEYDDETLGRARVNEELNTVLQRAKDRKLEEMKRFEMLQQQLEATKLKRFDGENNDNKDNEVTINLLKSRSEFSKDKNDESNDNKEINNKYLPPRLQKQFEQNNDSINKVQNITSTKGIKTLCRTDSDMSSSGYSEYRSESWIDDDHTNKSSSLKRDKRSEFDRYRREKSRSDPKDKNDRYTHNDYSSRMDDSRKNFDHKRDFKRNDSGSNVKKSGDDNYEIDRNDKKESFSKVSKYHSRDSLEPQEEIEKDNVQIDDESYSWGQKSLSKDFYKDDINSSGQYGKKYIPGPITQEKLEACELTSEPKRNLNQLVKSERKDTKKNDQGDELSTKANTGVWDLVPTNKNKILQEQNQSKLEQETKSGKTGQKNDDDCKLSETKSSLENNSGTSTLSHHKGMRSDRNVGSRSYHQSIISRTVSRSGSNRKNTWPESYEEGQRSRGPPRRDRGEERNRNEDRNRGDDRNRNDDRNRGEDRNRNDDRNRGDDRNRNDDRNRGSNRQNDRYSEKSTLRGYGQRSEPRGRGRLSNMDTRIISGRSGQKNNVDESVEKNKTNQNLGSIRNKNSLSKTQSKMDSYAMSGDTTRRSGDSRFGSRQNNRHLNSQKPEENWDSVSEPSDYEAQQKNSNRRQSTRTYLASSRGEKRSNYDKKDQSKESGSSEKSNQKLNSTTSSNDLKNNYGGSSSQDGRSNKKDDQRKSNDSQQKNQRLTNQSNRKDQLKSSSRCNQNSSMVKPGQTNQRYERQKSQPQIGLDDSNAPIIKDTVVMVNNNPPPPPQTNAWDKPITHALRAQSPNVNKPVALQSNNRANSLTEIKEISGQTSQRLASNKEKGSPNVMENGILDSSQRMETIIFENTTYKSKPCGESKNKYNSNIKQRNEKDTCNFSEDTQETCFRAFKSTNSDNKDSKLNEAVQMMSFKNDESSDLNLGFGDFESDFTRSGGHLSAENKDVMAMSSHSRSIHTGPSSLKANDLKTMIAGTKKVWDDKPDSNQQVQQNIAESAFNTVYSTASTGQHDKSDISVIDEQRVHNQQVYSPAPQLQNVAGSYIPVSMAAAGQLKQDPNAATTNVCKVKPQPQGTLSPPLSQQQQQQSSTSTHVFSSTTPQPHTSATPLANTIPTQATHMNLQIMMENSEGLPDMYGAHILKQQQTHLILNTNNKTGVEMLAKQFVSAAPGPSPSSAILFNSAQQHLMPPPSPSAPQVYQTMLEPSQTVINNTTRSQYNQFTYGLQSNGLNQNSPQFNPSMYIHATTPTGQGGSEVFQPSISPFRIGPAYNNGQQMNTNLNPVLIPSSTNSSSSQVKQSSQQIGTIGNKTTYNNTTPQPSPFMVQYDPMFNQQFNSINNANARPLQSSSSLYSTNSGTGPTNPGYLPNVASAFQAQVVAGASGGNTFGIPTAFGSQNAPPPNMQNYTSQYRQVPYMKGNLGGGNGTNDLQKSGISNQQDLGNPMFSSNLFRQQQFFETNKPLMNSNQQTHQAMQGKYSNYQVSASQNNQLSLMPRMNMNNSNSGSMTGNIAPQQYPSPIQRPVSTFQHIQRMPPPQNMRMQPNCAPIQHLMNKSQSSNNYFVSNAGLIVEPPMPLPNKIDNANVNVDSKAEEKIDSSSSKPQNTENKDDKPLAANE